MSKKWVGMSPSSPEQMVSNAFARRLTIITMVKKTTKGAAKSDETGGIADSRAGSGYYTEATGGIFDPAVDFGDVGAQGAPPTTATAGGFCWCF
jgi:hypothetical protein